MGVAVRWIVVIAALAAGVFGAMQILQQAGSGQQPWDPELSDNFVFIKSIPFVLALGVAVGFLRGRDGGEERRGDLVRRFRPGTVLGHWVAAIGFVLAMPTGMWQYLGGILSQDTPAPGGQILLDLFSPIPLYWIYRLHYVGGAVILFSVAHFATYWWVSADRALLPPRGQWRAHLSAFAQGIPSWLGARIGGPLRLDLRRAMPAARRFSYYETAFSFPSWTIVIALITVTGLIKAMRYVYPVPPLVLYASSTLHVAAMVLIFIKVLDHLRYTLARWPMMTAMAKGWVREGAIRRVLDDEVQPPPPSTEEMPARQPAGAMSGSRR
jgi:cytochrome b subunit of formate dehydrogenase